MENKTIVHWSPSLGSWRVGDQIRFVVWAPRAKTVEVALEKEGEKAVLQALEKKPDGLFVGSHPLARVGDLYTYRLDGDKTYPDPASRYQPRGVHGPSQVVDPNRFTWTDETWRGIAREDLVIYELHIGTFSPEGTFDGAIKRLSHLVDLGVTAIEIMPVADFPGDRNWGYDGVALFAPARCYGSPDDMRRLVDAAHRLGVAVLLDVVYNHLGPDGNYLGVYSSSYFTDKHKTAWGSALNFDSDYNQGVREFFIQNALHWVHEYHVDGLRLDAIHAILDDSPKHFLSELTARVQESAGGRILHVIGEDHRNLVSMIQPRDKGGEGLSAVWSDDFHHQVRRIFAGDKDGYFVDFTDRPEDVAMTVNQGWFYSGQNAAFFKGPRGTPTRGMLPEQFVFFIQNHDQIGNRAAGDRLHHSIDMASYRAATAVLLCAPETPLLFMGQEWAASAPFQYFTDHNPELGKLVTEGRTREFKSFASFGNASTIPDPQAPATFTNSKLNWEEIQKEPYKSIWLFYRALLKFRREEFKGESHREDVTATPMNDSGLLIKRWSFNGVTLLILVQLKGGGVMDLAKHPALAHQAPQEWTVILSSEERAFCPDDPKSQEILLSGDAPTVTFLRPGAVILKGKPKTQKGGPPQREDWLLAKN